MEDYLSFQSASFSGNIFDGAVFPIKSSREVIEPGFDMILTVGENSRSGFAAEPLLKMHKS